MKVCVWYSAIAYVDVPTDDLDEARRMMGLDQCGKMIDASQIELLGAKDQELISVDDVQPVEAEEGSCPN